MFIVPLKQSVFTAYEIHLSCVYCTLETVCFPMLLNTFFAASMVFPNNPLSFNMLSASHIMFISYRIRHHMTNSMKHKYNINTSNNTSVITYYRAYITFSKAPGLHCQESLREIFAILVAAVLPQRRFFIDYFLKSFSTLQ